MTSRDPHNHPCGDAFGAAQGLHPELVEDLAAQSVPEVYWFADGEIWSGLGGKHALSIGGAKLTLEDLARRADPTSRLYWPNACDDLRKQLANAIEQYRAFHTARRRAFA